MKPDLVIFDGSNFYHFAKNLSPKTHLTDFNYRKLVEIVTGNNKNQIEYCVGEVRQERYRNSKSFKLYSNQQSLFYNLGKQNIIIKKGFMLRRNLSYFEKGVDVRIAIDILKGALKNEYNRCYIISSDTDIIPAILDAKVENKEIIYVGFENFVSRAMRSNCSRTILISKKMIKECVS